MTKPLIFYCAKCGLADTPKVREFRDQLVRAYGTEQEAIQELLERRQLRKPEWPLTARKGIYSGPVIGYERIDNIRHPHRQCSGMYVFRIFVLKGHPKAKYKERTCHCEKVAAAVSR